MRRKTSLVVREELSRRAALTALPASTAPLWVTLRSHLRLVPDGSVPVCQFNTEKIGNLLHQSFQEVWYGEETQPSREWVDNCACCWAECEVIPSALYTGRLLSHAVLSHS